MEKTNSGDLGWLLSERRKRNCERAYHEHENKSASRIHPITSNFW